MEKEINQHKGYIQNTLKSLSNLSQRINHVNKVYNWGLRLHLNEAWIADKTNPEDKELLKKIKHNNEKIVFLKVKLNINCNAVNTSFLKKKKAMEVSATLKQVFQKDGPISGFSFVSCIVEGFSYAHVVLAMHINSFPHILNDIKFIESAQKKMELHIRMQHEYSNSRSKKINYGLMKLPEYALVIDQISRHEKAIHDLLQKKIALEQKHKQEANQKLETPWPMSEKEFNRLINLKNRIPLKDCKYTLY